MVADVHTLGGFYQGFDNLGIAVTEAVCTAVDVNVHELFAVHIPEIITFALADNEVDAEVKPLFGFAAVPIGDGFIKDFLFSRGFKNFRYVHKYFSFRCEKKKGAYMSLYSMQAPLLMIKEKEAYEFLTLCKLLCFFLRIL